MSEHSLFIMLASGTREKIQLAAMVASVAAVSSRPTEILVTMGALRVFDASLPEAERFEPGGISQILADRGAPDPLELLGQGRMLGDLKIYACPMALDILKLELENLTPDLFDDIVGMTKFLSDAESGELIVI